MKIVWVTTTLIVCISLGLLAAACQDEEEGTPTPAGTPTATATGVPTPGVVVDGVEEIVLGADVPLSGAFGAVYSTIPRATEAYFNYINDTQGGVCGREIVYKVEDNQNDPAKAVEAVRKLVERDQVFAMVGSLADDPHAAIWDYLNEKEVPDILVSAGAHRFGTDPEGHPWTFQMIPSYTVEGTFYGQYISENLPGKKVAVLYENGPAGHDGLAGMKMGLDPDKNEIVSEQTFELTAISVRSQVANMKGAGAEVVAIFTDPGFTSQAIIEASRLDWQPDWFMSYVNSDEMMFQFVSPELLDGAITFQAFKLAAMKEDPAVARHYEIMGQYGGPGPTNFTLYAQLLAEVAVEVLGRTCDNLTRQGLVDAVKSLKGWHSDLLLDDINITFSENDRIAIQTGRMLRATVEDGKGKFEYFGPMLVFEEEEPE
jgi:branched-chain amino acid transport system substrate-binding protein